MKTFQITIRDIRNNQTRSFTIEGEEIAEVLIKVQNRTEGYDIIHGIQEIL